MWELMAIGIEMQRRMIEVHAQGLKLTGDMLREVERRNDSATMMREAQAISAGLTSRWFDAWRGRS